MRSAAGPALPCGECCAEQAQYVDDPEVPQSRQQYGQLHETTKYQSKIPAAPYSTAQHIRRRSCRKALSCMQIYQALSIGEMFISFL
jgi:hypothetical protein